MDTISPADILSLVALVIALTSTVINYLVLKAQRDPEVIVYAIHDQRRPSFINLIIENSGAGSAHDVTFQANRSIPARAFGFEDAKKPEAMTDGPLIRGVPTLGCGDKRIITWGQYGGLKKGLGDDVLDITATYFSRLPLSFTRQRHTTTSRIDLRSFEGTDASDHNWDKKTADQLEKIANAIAQITDARRQSLKVVAVPDEPA